jgi:glycosyltransferase involved in cell wall biosynthesis
MAFYIDSLAGARSGATILDCIDVVFSKYDQISRLEPKLSRRIRTWLHSRMMRLWEPRQAMRFDRCLAMSERDRRRLLAASPRLRVEVVPNGVDTQLLKPLPPHIGRPALIFVGNMQYRPNIDAAMELRHRILPLVRREAGPVEMWIVGTDPPPEVRQLAGDGVHVTGRVNDVQPFYQRSSVCVVPLRAGSGTRLKILEAMALGRPVVSTPVGCEGLEASDGEHIHVAHGPDEFALKTVQLLTDEGLRRSTVESAREMVVARYDWDVIADKLGQVYEEASHARAARNGLLSSATG